MSAKSLPEASGKHLLSTHLPTSTLYTLPPSMLCSHTLTTTSETNTQFQQLEKQNPWLRTEKLVVKPDQLIKRRGKAGLLGLNLEWTNAKTWIIDRQGKEIKVDGITGLLKTFIIEPFVPHAQETEHYICIQSNREGDLIYFYHAGGVDVGDVDSKALTYLHKTNADQPTTEELTSSLLKDVKNTSTKPALAEFILNLLKVYADLQFTYLEINPLVCIPGKEKPTIVFLDLAAKLDQTAEFECGKAWGPIQFPAPFGRELSKEEQYIADLDGKTGASLKLTILNRNGRIWTMVAGGGASVVYSDAIAAQGYAHELANYGEYSGAPSETQTYEYAKTLLELLTSSKVHPEGKVLIIGGGIANFTNVAATFKGIIRALREYQAKLIQHEVKVFVRRGGPNYQEGLKAMRTLGETLGVPIHVYGPETHITAIIPLALSKEKIVHSTSNNELGFAESMFMGGTPVTTSQNNLAGPAKIAATLKLENPTSEMARFSPDTSHDHPNYAPFTKNTRAFIWGMQPRAVQGMLDFDHMCGRHHPSVAGMIYPFGGTHVQKFYWGAQETLLPVFTGLAEASGKFPEVDTVINFASFRSVYSTTVEIIEWTVAARARGEKGIASIAIIAEGVPERRARSLIALAAAAGVMIIGPATVGGIKPGCFKIGNTGGMIDNIVSCRLYRPGSVAYVSKSGGMSNELNNLLARTTDGAYEGVAIGGDRYPGTTFIDHILRYEADPAVKMIVLLGEVGGTEEYNVAKACKTGKITKPVVAWCIGTCAGLFGSEVQFGHAGALANSDSETAEAKNKALKEAGVLVPDSFELLPKLLSETYFGLVQNGTIVPKAEPEPPKVPIDYSWAQELGLIRKPASFVSTICDDRGQELLYAGMPISEVFKEEIGIGGVFIEMVLMLTADHGPAVSGAHNTIVTARAGKDLISCLTAGLLTIGDRFGGALDGAAEQFSGAFDKGLTPQEFVDKMRLDHQLIMGIGHKIKSKTNPDLRVSILLEFARRNFPAHPLLDYALQVENLTTAKKDNLILNVDGATGVLFVDLLRNCGAFTREESDEYVKYGTLNGLFVLGRSIGFIGHYIDQKRLKQGLYRHPWDDISYLLPDQSRVLVSESHEK